MRSLTKLTLASALVAVLGTAARAAEIPGHFRHGGGELRADRLRLEGDWRDVRRDRAELRNDLRSGDYAAARTERRDLWNDYRDVRRDRGARRDLRDIRGDRQDLRNDWRDVQRDRRELGEDLRHGDSQAAQAERQELRDEYRDIRNDRRDLRADWYDLHGAVH